MTTRYPTRWRRDLLCALLLLGGGRDSKAEFVDTMVPITGTIIASAPCKINNEQLIEVNFGNELLTTRIDGVNYRKAINYTLDCREASNNSLRLQIQGTVAAFDAQVLSTAGRSNLGIRVMEGGNVLPVNTWLKFQYPLVPVLSAVPVKQAGSTLAAGSFSAGATLLVEYQ